MASCTRVIRNRKALASLCSAIPPPGINFAWQMGLIAGPALTGIVMSLDPYALWPVCAMVLLGCGVGSLLLERCLPGAPLSSRPEPDQDQVIADLLRRFWVTPEPGHHFRPLQLMCNEWADEFERKMMSGQPALDPGIAREGIALFRSLPASGRFSN